MSYYEYCSKDLNFLSSWYIHEKYYYILCPGFFFLRPRTEYKRIMKRNNSGTQTLLKCTPFVPLVTDFVGLSFRRSSIPIEQCT